MIDIAWILNLDADVEFANADTHRPSANLHRLTRTQGRRFLELANDYAPSDVRHLAVEDLKGARPTLVEAWSPTPWALARAADLGLGDLLRSRNVPRFDILRHVNHRSFAPRIGTQLPGAAFAFSMHEVEQILASWSPPGGWLLKRPFGFSGRARKRVHPPLSAPDRRWVEASMRDYGKGLQVEPFVSIVSEITQHGFLDTAGGCLFGRPTAVSCDESGAWIQSRPLRRDEPCPGEEVGEGNGERVSDGDRIRNATTSALREAGYFGPFSIDGYSWRAPNGDLHWRGLGEINARYSMGFFAGLADRQAEWVVRINSLQRLARTAPQTDEACRQSGQARPWSPGPGNLDLSSGPRADS